MTMFAPSVGDESVSAACRRFLANAGRPGGVRALLDGTASTRDEWARLVAFGLPELVADADDDAELAALLVAVGIEGGRALYAGPILEGCAAGWVARVASASRVPSGAYGPGDLYLPAFDWTMGRHAGEPVRTSKHGEAGAADGASAAPPRLIGDRLLGLCARVPFADAADGFLVRARRDDGASCLVAVPREQPGVATRLTRQVDGTQTGSVVFDSCPVAPADAWLVGADCEAATLRILEFQALATSARLVGVAQRAAETTREYLGVRRQFGRSLASFQVLQHRMVDLYVEVALAGALLERLAAGWADSHGRRPALHALKALASTTAQKVCKDAVQLHGAIGFSDECDVGLCLRLAVANAARGGDAAEHRRWFADEKLDLFG